MPAGCTKCTEAFAPGSTTSQERVTPTGNHVGSRIRANQRGKSYGSSHWDESAATNEKAWKVSESDIKHNHESGALCDFHSLNYLQYAYLQRGRYRDARRVTQIFADEYQNSPDRTTAPDSATLEVRHLRGRTIYAIPDRVVYGFFAPWHATSWNRASGS